MGFLMIGPNVDIIVKVLAFQSDSLDLLSTIMAVNPTGLAYALVVLLSILLIISILQIIQAVHSLRREKSGQPTASRRSLIFLTAAVVSLTISYAFDLVVISLALVVGSETPPPSQAYLVGVVISFFTGNGLAPSMLYASAADVIESRKDFSAAAQSLLGAARRPSAEWAPPKSVGEREVIEGDVPGDLHDEPTTQRPRPGHGRKASRADSIALSPTRTSFSGPIIRTEGEANPTTN
ncbi:hypothetical protein FS842_007369 [Serendipita sp. 407]|nr:hypothetical protein FS842_007369 [Serendipita sp. 407]